jgi:hypothetical protein
MLWNMRAVSPELNFPLPQRGAMEGLSTPSPFRGNPAYLTERIVTNTPASAAAAPSTADGPPSPAKKHAGAEVQRKEMPSEVVTLATAFRRGPSWSDLGIATSHDAAMPRPGALMIVMI